MRSGAVKFSYSLHRQCRHSSYRQTPECCSTDTRLMVLPCVKDIEKALARPPAWTPSSLSLVLLMCETTTESSFSIGLTDLSDPDDVYTTTNYRRKKNRAPTNLCFRLKVISTDGIKVSPKLGKVSVAADRADVSWRKLKWF
ncbi:unnamed protein product [Pleuronectes platessa]|uniref:Uncharacterized protein n=1 Tax=Pleuronectes platessa TaxID=8262 RepID=A0A9N7YTM1_PLEPL|nr:unnamed protein product [Pleuronectes platessa]